MVGAPHRQMRHRQRPAASLVALALAVSCLAALAPLVDAGDANVNFREVNNCKECVGAGYGWCPRRRKCGYFKNRACSGTRSDFAVGVNPRKLNALRDLTPQSFSNLAYDEKRMVFVVFYSGAEPGQKQVMQELSISMQKSDPDLYKQVRFAAVNHDRYPSIAEKHGMKILALPTVAAFNEEHRPSDDEDSHVRDVPMFPFRWKHNAASYTQFMTETLDNSRARLPELDALVPAFMAAVTGESNANATELYLEAQQIVADLIGSLVQETEDAAADLEAAVAARKAKAIESGAVVDSGDSDATEDASSEVALSADGGVEASDSNEEETPLPSVDERTVAKIGALKRGAGTIYLDAMDQIVRFGWVRVVRQVNRLKQMGSPRPLKVRYKLEILQVFTDQLF